MREVWITGIGLVSSLGDGTEEHWTHLQNRAAPRTAPTARLPNLIHPLVEVDYSRQIPRRSDQRQMGPWQLLGTYAAGAALQDAGIAGDAEACQRLNMVIAAGGGERDFDSDNRILESLETCDAPEARLNALMMDELRPTLFLAQLPNLLAGNISIVHGVTGSSRTFMGEEPAGVSAVEVAFRRIHGGQGDLFLVGAANNADRAEMLLLLDLARKLWPGEVRPVWSRQQHGGGVVLGSLGAFLVLESSEHAAARGARPYACIADVASDRRRWIVGAEVQTSGEGTSIGTLTDWIAPGKLAVISGASGAEPATGEERAFLACLKAAGHDLAVRATGTVLGHGLEAQFPAGLAIAALAISKGRFYPPFDDEGFEQPAAGPCGRVVVTSWGHWHGQGLALLEWPERSRTGRRAAARRPIPPESD